MSKYLCTFSGKYGDILWSLPTAKFISEKIVSDRVDFAIMPYYQSLLPLLVEQSYIDRAYVITNWLRTHSNHGDQPWQPPDPEVSHLWLKKIGGEEPHVREEVGNDYFTYEKKWHLTYRGHPGISAPTMPLVQFIAYQQGINLGAEGYQFIDVSEVTAEEAKKIQFNERCMWDVIEAHNFVTYSFNDQYAEQKKAFFEALWKPATEKGFCFFDVSSVGWKEAAWLIKKSLVYVGCRSACWVLANGLGKQTITYEPHPSRHKSCHLGTVFGNPYGLEIALPFGVPPAVAAETAASLLVKMREERQVIV